MYEDNIVPIIVAAIFLFVLGYMLGFTMTEKRIYNNCLNNNSTMIYQEAVAKCRDVVK